MIPTDDAQLAESTSAARDRILTTAHELFYRLGVRATGIDRIIAESGVAKQTFYRHFRSKDELVKAFLQHRHERWIAWFIDALGRHGAAPSAGLMPLVDVMQEWFDDPLFRGCAFINALAELHNQPGVVGIVLDHKLQMQEVIAALIADGPAQAGTASAAALALDGAIVRAQMAVTGQVSGDQKKSALDGLRQVLMVLDNVPAAPDRAVRRP